jgi:hypothetical protein
MGPSLSLLLGPRHINNGISTAEHTKLCENSEEDINKTLNENFEDEGRYTDMKNSVTMTWLFSFIQICRQDELAEE